MRCFVFACLLQVGFVGGRTNHVCLCCGLAVRCVVSHAFDCLSFFPRSMCRAVVSASHTVVLSCLCCCRFVLLQVCVARARSCHTQAISGQPQWVPCIAVCVCACCPPFVLHHSPYAGRVCVCVCIQQQLYVRQPPSLVWSFFEPSPWDCRCTVGAG